MKSYCLPAIFANLLKMAYETFLFYGYSAGEKKKEKKKRYKMHRFRSDEISAGRSDHLL